MTNSAPENETTDPSPDRVMANSAPTNNKNTAPKDAMTNSAPDKGTVAPSAARKTNSHASVSTNDNMQNQSDKEHGDDDLVTTPSVDSPNEDANDSDYPDDTVESPPATPKDSRKKRKLVSAKSPQTPAPDKAQDDEAKKQRCIKERIERLK